jgi:methylmalonyl-CoA mutase cobalamin-binding subunit
VNSKILLGTCGSDVHSVANNLVEKCLIDIGIQVRNLGVAVSITEWLDNVQNFNPDLVMVGSMNGDLQPLVELISSLVDAGYQADRVIVGGKLRLGSDGPSLIPFISASGVTVIESENPTFIELQNIVLDKLMKFSVDVNAKSTN